IINTEGLDDIVKVYTTAILIRGWNQKGHTGNSLIGKEITRYDDPEIQHRIYQDNLRDELNKLKFYQDVLNRIETLGTDEDILLYEIKGRIQNLSGLSLSR
ncbi:MAG: hypothetical protein RI556_12615, partial [Hydrogenovibrio sp.]|uniref:hypothetical protein n=1 Tax=Hydrogenovibrio sp. TaxID=2065821 RepID=UPI0028707CF5